METIWLCLKKADLSAYLPEVIHTPEIYESEQPAQAKTGVKKVNMETAMIIEFFISISLNPTRNKGNCQIYCQKS